MGRHIASFNQKLVQRDDGSLSFDQAERMALMMADGAESPEAWKALGGKTNSGSGELRRRVIVDPVFKLRLEELMAEKAELEEDPIWGKPRWMAEQLWREARATGDLQLALKAAEMRTRIAEKSTGAAPKPDAPAEDADKPKRRPGAPSIELPKVSNEMEDLKRRLADRGIEVASVADEEAAA